MKDYYDLYRVLSTLKYDSGILKEAVIRTFKNRHTSYDENTMFFRKEFADNQRMNIRWQAFNRKMAKDTELSFTEVATFIQDTLKPYWRNLSHSG